MKNKLQAHVIMDGIYNMPFIRRYIARVLWRIHNARHDTFNISNIVVRESGGGGVTKFLYDLYPQYPQNF